MLNYKPVCLYFLFAKTLNGIRALMAEWLRRVIRNHLGSSRAGSNPVQCDHFLIIFQYKLTDFLSKVLTGHSGVIIYLNKKFNWIKIKKYLWCFVFLHNPISIYKWKICIEDNSFKFDCHLYNHFKDYRVVIHGQIRRIVLLDQGEIDVGDGYFKRNVLVTGSSGRRRPESLKPSFPSQSLWMP